MTAVDVVIVGQGFAGTALAWHLRWRGASVLVVDREAGDTASRVAAGLLTPVTGRRLAPTPDFAALRRAAEAFYRRVEAETGVPFFHPAGAVRLFADAAERDRALRKGVADLDPPLPAGLAAPYGGFAMPTAARLLAEPYLRASRDHFTAAGQYVAADLDLVRDIEPTAAGLRLSRLGVTAGRVVLCVGAAACPGFPAVRPDAGEVLTVRIPDLAETRTVHRGVWLAPLGDDRFRAGATYTRDQADAAPTPAGRADLLDRLAAFVQRPITVLGHRAGARPVAAGHAPLVAPHPAELRLWCLTGLASKGALTAPTLAGQLADRWFRPTA